MGTKATYLLIRIIIGLFTLVIAVLTVTGWFARSVSPEQSWFVTWVSLGMLPLILINLGLLIYWSVKRRLMLIIPLGVILLNYGTISALLQLRFTSKEIPQYDLKVATYNVHAFAQLGLQTTVRHISQFMQQNEVDVLCMQEFKELPHFNIDSIAAAFSFLPYHALCTQPEGMTVAIFSRFPITASELLPFENTTNCAMWADIDVNGRRARIVNCHLQTTSISQSRDEIAQLKNQGVSDPQGKQALDVLSGRLHANYCKRAKQVKIVRTMVDSLSIPVAVCGDFNDTPGSYTYNQMVKGLTDGFRSSGSGYAYTYQPMHRILRLDYILYNGGFEATKYFSTPLRLSDHNPVLLSLRFRNC